MALDTIDSAWREDNILGDSGSGKYRPLKAPMRRVLKRMEGMAAAGVVHKATRAQLFAITPATELYGGAVYADPNPTYNGIYVRDAATWVKVRGLPDTVAELTVTGGTENAVQASVAAGVDPAIVKVYYINVATPNTGNVTISISGAAAIPCYNIAGTDFAPGEWDGRLFLANDAPDYLVAITDASAAISAAASAAAAAADRVLAEAARDDAINAMVYNPVIVRGVTTNAGPYDMGQTIGSANLLDVKLNGLEQDHNKYTVDGTTFTFTDDPGAGIEWEGKLKTDLRVVNQPGDGSVNLASLDPSLLDYLNETYVAKNPVDTMPTLAITFDYYVEGTTTAFDIMDAAGLVGTFYVDPATIDTPSGPSLSRLILMKGKGWEIGMYSSTNWVTAEADNRVIFMETVRDMRAAMEAVGLPATSVAPNQRAWNSKLRNLMRGHFTHVREVANFRSTLGHWQALPVPDLLWISEGGTASFTTADTGASLSAQVDDLIALGGLWTAVIHRVAESGDTNYRIGSVAFQAFVDKVKAEKLAGNLRVICFSDIKGA